jgi:hypothetical protein
VYLINHGHLQLPRLLLATIHEEYLTDNYDYDITDSLDYTDPNPSILMATITPHSDSIVIPVSLAGHNSPHRLHPESSINNRSPLRRFQMAPLSGSASLPFDHVAIDLKQLPTSSEGCN